MPKLILRCNYLKNAPPSHLANYMNYISIREGVEKIDNTCGLLPATVKQKELIADILSKIEDADRIREQIEEMQEKIENGEINETFQIGGQSFTVEEWNEFLEKFDSIQEVLEALMKERHAQKEESDTDGTIAEMLSSESTSCTYPASGANREDVR